jgi:hypothetical protein
MGAPTPSSDTPSSPRMPVPLLHSVTAAPVRRRPGACSNTMAWWPSARSARAAARPPIPAPMISTFMTGLPHVVDITTIILLLSL